MKKGYTIRIKYKIIFSFIIIISIFAIFIYEFDKTVMPTVIAVSEAEMRAKAIEIMNKTIIDEFMKQFNYNDVIKIDKDKNGNIVLLKADTLRLNKIACDVAIKAQKALSDLGNVGIQLPIGYITRNNVLSYFGPSIKIKMQPIGFIETRYSSEFESAGINQTRHKIYINMKTKIRIIIPLKSSDVEVSNEIPIAETIIVGKIPKTAIQMDLNDAGFRLKNFSD
ncbi:sporulation protein YunB [Clostridium tepidiprofundi DSM 19306]|uniref:Sporulation protein YunB n=1 Tax=Clostridium tepidiprofundi DSM 19306 TaxID=1121338 RepID=A0A151B5Q4_9CLOT|nr:sporulation protein YunB [Clostridium tepidiprofundi]KYH35092.1 sporulation protein YunB [Clostridium tepidiprofundi DSM 19306]